MKEGHYLCILGTFDKETNRHFKELDQIMQKAGLRTLGSFQEDPWHFSLGVYHDLEPEELIAWTREIAGEMEEIPLRFNHIGIFPGVVFIEPSFSWRLRNFFERLHEKYDDRYGEYIATSRKHGLFTPHVSMIFTYDELVKAVETLYPAFTPFYGKMSELVIYEYVQKGDKSFPVGEVEIIKLTETRPIGGNSTE